MQQTSNYKTTHYKTTNYKTTNYKTTNATKLPMQKKHIMLQTPKKQCLKKAKIWQNSKKSGGYISSKSKYDYLTNLKYSN